MRLLRQLQQAAIAADGSDGSAATAAGQQRWQRNATRADACSSIVVWTRCVMQIKGVLCAMTILHAGARTPIELTEQSGINYHHNTELG